MTCQLCLNEGDKKDNHGICKECQGTKEHQAFVRYHDSGRLEKHMLEAGISPRHSKASFADFPFSKANTIRDAAHVSYFAEGIPGTGKTHIACASISYALVHKKGTCLFASVPKLIVDLQSVYKDGSGKTLKEEIQPYMDADLLVMDDIGVEKPTEWVRNVLYLIIDYRYGHLKQTIFTSNCSLQQLNDHLGTMRITHRIAEMCKTIKFDEENKRKKGLVI